MQLPVLRAIWLVWLGLSLLPSLPAGAKQDWFCQIAEDMENWACVQDAAQARNPQPERLPVPQTAHEPAPAPVPTVPTPAAAEPGLNDNSGASRPSMPQPAPTPPPAAVSEQESLPLHQQLAYHPAQATSFMDLPAEFWAVQVMALSTPEAVETYVRTANLKRMSAAVIESDGRLMYAIILGIYDTRDKAQRVANALPHPFEAVTPYVRTVASLQHAITRAQTLAPPSRDGA